MAMLNRLLSMIKCTKTYLRKSEMCTGDAYRVTLTYKGNRCSFVFHDNFRNESTKKDFIYCLVLDAQAYDNARDFYDFATEFGYDYTRDSEARKAYRACEKQSDRLHRLFNQQEIDILSEIE